jgi:hypothetical protein
MVFLVDVAFASKHLKEGDIWLFHLAVHRESSQVTDEEIAYLMHGMQC